MPVGVAAGIAVVADQLDPVPGALQMDDLDLRRRQPGHPPEQSRIARRPREQLEAEQILEKADRPVEVGDDHAGMIEAPELDCRHAPLAARWLRLRPVGPASKLMVQ